MFSLALMSQGVIQNLHGRSTVHTEAVQSLDPHGEAVATQTLPGGPVASMTTIELLGSNGGGYFNAERRPPARRKALFEPQNVRRAVADSFQKLDPRVQARNPIMFVVLVGSVWTTILFALDLGSAPTATSVFGGLVALWLWFTLLFANFAEGIAEDGGRPRPKPCAGPARRRMKR